MDHNRRIGFLASLGFTQQTPEQVLKSLSEIGYTAVEWTLCHFNPRTMSAKQLTDLVNLTHSYGMETSEVVVQQDLVSLDPAAWEDRVTLTEECIRAAGDAGIQVLNVLSGPMPWDPSAPVVNQTISEQEAWAMVFRAFDRLVPLAEERGVYLALEAVFGMLCRDYYTSRVLIDHYDSEHMAINMDPSHYRLYRNDVPWVVREWGSRIKHVHLKDVIGVHGQIGETFMFPLLGEGLIDWKSFATTLDEVGYEGAMSVEFESFRYYSDVLGGDPVAAAKLSMEQVKALL